MTDLRLVVEPHAPESLKQHVRDRLDLYVGRSVRVLQRKRLVREA